MYCSLPFPPAQGSWSPVQQISSSERLWRCPPLWHICRAALRWIDLSFQPRRYVLVSSRKRCMIQLSERTGSLRSLHFVHFPSRRFYCAVTSSRSLRLLPLLSSFLDLLLFFESGHPFFAERFLRHISADSELMLNAYLRESSCSFEEKLGGLIDLYNELDS